jgi:superfamily II DNA or RNA helicase
MIPAEPWAWIAPLTPRPWQEPCIAAIKRAGLGSAPVCHVVMGAGKSITIAEIVRRIVVKGRRVVLTVPSVKLVEQMRATCIQALGTRAVGCVYTHEHSPHRPLSIVCHDSIWRWVDAGGEADVWIADECHRTEGPEIARWVDECAPRWRVGFSATPWLATDDRAIRAFKEVAFSYGPREAIEDGVLVPWRVRVLPGVEGDAVDRLLEMWSQWPPDGPGIISAASIVDADEIARRVSDAGYPAKTIHSRISQGEREAREIALKEGRLSAVVHVNMLVEGADYPWLQWIAMLRATSNRVRYPQELGRVLRSHPGKERATVYDVHRITEQYGMTYDAALGWAAPEKKKGAPEEAGLMPPPPVPSVIVARETSAWRAWATMTLHDLELAGIIGSWKMKASDRDLAPTAAQIRAAGRAIEDFDTTWRGPNEAREHVREAVRAAALGGWTRGDTSDALSLYAAGRVGWGAESLAAG